MAYLTTLSRTGQLNLQSSFLDYLDCIMNLFYEHVVHIRVVTRRMWLNEGVHADMNSSELLLRNEI